MKETKHENGPEENEMFDQYIKFPYNKLGNYLFTGCGDLGLNKESHKGYILSSEFVIGGTGYITFSMSGGKNPQLCYISIIDVETQTEIARFANELFADNGTGLINRGSNLMNMVQYKADLSEFMGKTVQIKVVDNAESDWGLICVDSFITYYENINAISKSAYEVQNILNNGNLEKTDYQIENGNFETGDLTGWTLDGGNFIGIGSGTIWWNENYLFNKSGTFFLSGWSGAEDATGTLTSSTFEVAGSGYITFKLGGGKDSSLCYVEILDADTNEVLRKYGNSEFKEFGKSYLTDGNIVDLSADGYYLANMVQYKADLSEYIGRNVKIRIVDNATNDWGLLFCDDFITYYVDINDINSNAILAENIK